MGQTTSKNTTNYKNKRKSISKLFHAQISKLVPTWFLLVPMDSLVHRSVPTNLKRFPNCSPAHTFFQHKFKDVQVGSRWFSTLYILSPNFHRKRSSHDAKLEIVLTINFSTQLGGRTTSWSPRPMFYSSENEILQWPFFAKTGAPFANSSTFASPEGTSVSLCHTINC